MTWRFVEETPGVEDSYENIDQTPLDEDAISHKEKERSPEKEKMLGARKVVVRGSIAYALATNKDLNLARDVDVFFVTKGSDKDVEINYFSSIDDAKKVMGNEELGPIEGFLSTYSLQEYSLQVIRISEGEMSRNSLYENEPEVVLWDSGLDVKSKLIKPLSEEEANTIRKQIEEKIKKAGYGDPFYREGTSMLETVSAARTLGDYSTFKLIKGSIPEYLYPKNPNLATTLRLLDLGMRFNIPASETALAASEEMLKDGSLRISIPKDRAVAIAEEEDFEDLEEEDDFYEEEYFSGSKRFSGRFEDSDPNSINQAFLNVLENKNLEDVLAAKFPNLAKICQEIKSAGGIRSYVLDRYGEAYLNRGFVNIGDPALHDIGIETARVGELISKWTNSLSSERKIFNYDLRSFLEFARDNNILDGDIFSRAKSIQMEKFRLSGDPAERRIAYESYIESCRRNIYSESSTYEENKKLLLESMDSDPDHRNRKFIIKGLVDVSTRKGDYAIASDFAEIVRKEASRKVAPGERPLTEGGMMALRALMELNNENVIRALSYVVTNKEIDPRIRKICLANLKDKRAFGSLDTYYFDLELDKELDKDARDINWEDIEDLLNINRVANVEVREKLRGISQSVFINSRYDGLSISETRKKLAPDLPPEMFFPLFSLFGQDEGRLFAWNRFIVSIKSRKVIESFIQNILEMHSMNREIVGIVTDRIVSAEGVGGDYALLVNRLVRKMKFISKVSKTHDSLEMLRRAEAPSLLEAAMDQVIVKGLYELTGRPDITADKIQLLFKYWDDPEPIFTYISKAASNGKDSRTFKLIGEMIAHMDPPDLTEWKQWRYDRSNSLVAEQLKGMTEQEVSEYSRDEFVDLGEVLVGLLPSDKPDRIKDVIAHGVGHDWGSEGSETPSARVVRLLPGIKSYSGSESSGNLSLAVKKDLAALDSKLGLISELTEAYEDYRVVRDLPKQLSSWQQGEVLKKESLRKLGFRGDESKEEIEIKIKDLKKANAPEKDINQLVNLKPTELPSKSKKLLEKYGLDESASPADSQALLQLVEENLRGIEKRDDISELKRSLFGDKGEIGMQEWQVAARDIKMAQNLAKISSLTPYLIAYNRLSQDKKKATLTAAIDSLKKYFEGEDAPLKSLGEIESIIKEVSAPVGKDHLAIIFTDNPLAMLTVGKFPYGATSCQNYENGSGLLAAYMGDGYTKMCIMVDLNKLPGDMKEKLEAIDDPEDKMRFFQTNTIAFLRASVARRLTKIVKDSSKNPNIFLEPVYTSLDRRHATRLLDGFAKTHLQRVGLPFVKGGGYENVTVSESRNFSQYEDGEHGGPGGDGYGIGSMSGSYTMPARPLQPSDYAI